MWLPPIEALHHLKYQAKYHCLEQEDGHSSRGIFPRMTHRLTTSPHAATYLKHSVQVEQIRKNELIKQETFKVGGLKNTSNVNDFSIRTLVGATLEVCYLAEAHSWGPIRVWTHIQPWAQAAHIVAAPLKMNSKQILAFIPMLIMKS